MNDVRSRKAEERLLDAALEQVLAGAGRGAGASVPRRSPRWFAAAMLLLGLSAIVATWWTARTEHGEAAQGGEASGASATSVVAPAPQDHPLQEPEQEPEPMVWARTMAELEAAPATVTRLTFGAPVGIDALARFPRLRELVLYSLGPGMRDEAWMRGDDILKPLQQLPALEWLELPDLPGLRPQQLAPLRGLPKLHTLVLAGLHADADLASALAALRLRTLALRSVEIDAGFLPGLQAAALKSLVLQSCLLLGPERQLEVASLRTLEALDIRSLVKVDKRWLPIDKAAFAAIGSLPRLRALSFGTGQDDEFDLLAQVPATLQRLDLVGSPLDAATAATLRRFGALRELSVRFADDAAADALAEVAGALRLQRFTSHGHVTGRLLQALAAQPDLVAVTLRMRAGLDLAVLAKAPKLRELSMTGYSAMILPTDYVPKLADVEPLAACKTLRRLELINFGLGFEAVQNAVGKAVHVEIVECL